MSRFATGLMWIGGENFNSHVLDVYSCGDSAYIYFGVRNETLSQYTLTYSLNFTKGALNFDANTQNTITSSFDLPPFYGKSQEKNYVVVIDDHKIRCAYMRGMRQEITSVTYEIASSAPRFSKNKSIAVEIDYPNLQTGDPPIDEGEITTMTPDKRKVFVVYGRDSQARDAIYEVIQALGLIPIDWSRAINLNASGTPYIGEIVDRAMEEAQAIIVLFTGDDEAKLKEEYISPTDPPFESTLTPQPRPNVIFEAGMALSKYPKRTILVAFGWYRGISDITGRYLQLWDNLPETRNTLAERLRKAGCEVDTSSPRFLNAGILDRFK